MASDTHLITSEQEKDNEGFAEIVGESELPDLLGIADKLGLTSNRQAPPIPDWVDQALINIGGLNKFGEPNFRIVWGQSATEHGWGQTRLKYPALNIDEQELLGHDIHNPNGKIHFIKGTKIPDTLKPGAVLVPRYKKKKVTVGLPFFIVERWHDVTEYFQPKGFHPTLEEAWEKELRWEWDEESGRRIDNMGPFPRRGVYLHFFTVKTPTLETRPIGEDVLNVIATTLRVESQVASGREYKLVLRDELEKQMAERRKPLLELQEKMQDAFNTPRLLGNPSVAVPASFEIGE